MWDWTYSFDIPAHITPMLYTFLPRSVICLLLSVLVHPMGFIFRLWSCHDMCYFASISFLVCIYLRSIMIDYILVLLILYFGLSGLG